MHRALAGRPWRPPSLVVLAVLSLSVAACLPSSLATDPPPDPTAAASAPASVEPTAVEPTPTQPTADPGQSTAAPVTPEPTPSEPVTPSPSPTSAAGGVELCTGTDDNRDFYEAVAQAVDWAVLCPVLPAGWFVDAGSYRLANGGRMEIGYRGPGGARLDLREGAFCPDTSGCVPAGDTVGDVAVGPFEGTLIATDDGGWAAVADPGGTISWLAVASGVDEATMRAIAEGLVEVEG